MHRESRIIHANLIFISQLGAVRKSWSLILLCHHSIGYISQEIQISLLTLPNDNHLIIKKCYLYQWSSFSLHSNYNNSWRLLVNSTHAIFATRRKPDKLHMLIRPRPPSVDSLPRPARADTTSHPNWFQIPISWSRDLPTPHNILGSCGHYPGARANLAPIKRRASPVESAELQHEIGLCRTIRFPGRLWRSRRGFVVADTSHFLNSDAPVVFVRLWWSVTCFITHGSPS